MPGGMISEERVRVYAEDAKRIAEDLLPTTAIMQGRSGAWAATVTATELAELIRRAWALAAGKTPETRKHLKTGGTYEVVGRGRVQTRRPLGDMDWVVVYQGEDEAIWVRSAEEFDEADRFETMEQGKGTG